MLCCGQRPAAEQAEKRKHDARPQRAGDMSTTAVGEEEIRWRETAFADGARRLRQLKAGDKPQHVPRDYAFVNDSFPGSRFDIRGYRISWGNSAKKYTIQWSDVLGEGAFGVVYKATNKATGEVVVAKTIKADKERLVALQQEVKMAELLAGGPNIVRLLDTVKTDTSMKVLVFEYVENPKYRKVFRQMGDLEARNYLYQLLLALNHCHSQGIVHRDVKAGNVLYDPATRTLRLIDLGFCTFYLPEYEATSWPGTRSYKAPEMFLHYKHYDYSADVWSYACIMGQIVFQRKSMFESDRAGDNHEIGSMNHMVAVCRALGTRDYAACLKKYGAAFAQRHKFPVAHFKKERCKSARVNWALLVNRHNKHLAHPDAIDLIDQLLVYDQEKRLTSREALLHRYFDPVRTVDYATLIRRSVLASSDDNDWVDTDAGAGAAGGSSSDADEDPSKADDDGCTAASTSASADS
eukprot:c16262_g1_i1.p1 GENE.c16262_g1_i1~~c16262_g1_i1.p1  ORF type:complete len:465 (+),score=103.81 c16262_g1_i1:191-1585(+)